MITTMKIATIVLSTLLALGATSNTDHTNHVSDIASTPTVGRLVADLDNDGSIDASGSCVVYKNMDNRYYAITCYHVIDKGDLFIDLFIDNKVRGTYDLDDFVRSPVRLEGACEELDLAVVSFESELTIVSAVLAPELPASYTDVYALGCPLGYPVVRTDGRFQFTMGKSAIITAPVIMGNSGGAILMEGTNVLVGITEGVRVINGGRTIVSHLHIITPSTIILQWLKTSKLL